MPPPIPPKKSPPPSPPKKSSPLEPPKGFILPSIGEVWKEKDVVGDKFKA
jgi:hypothetical protein